jgi:hypothetical protein
VTVELTTEHEGHGLTHRSASQYLQPAQVLRIEAQLYLPDRQRVIHLVAIASQRDRCRPRHPSPH